MCVHKILVKMYSVILLCGYIPSSSITASVGFRKVLMHHINTLRVAHCCNSAVWTVGDVVVENKDIRPKASLGGCWPVEEGVYLMRESSELY